MIDLTPLDVRNKRGDFKKLMRGYDPQEVDIFLELVAERLEGLVRENIQLKERTQTLQQQVTSQLGRERAVQDALVTAQELRADIKAQSQREAEHILKEAETETRRMIAEAEAQVRGKLRGVERRIDGAQDALVELERRRTRFLKEFRQLLERELDVVEVEEERTPHEDRTIDLDLGPLDTPDEEGDGEGADAEPVSEEAGVAEGATGEPVEAAAADDEPEPDAPEQEDVADDGTLASAEPAASAAPDATEESDAVVEPPASTEPDIAADAHAPVEDEAPGGGDTEGPEEGTGSVEGRGGTGSPESAEEPAPAPPADGTDTPRRRKRRGAATSEPGDAPATPQARDAAASSAAQPIADRPTFAPGARAIPSELETPSFALGEAGREGAAPDDGPPEGLSVSMEAEAVAEAGSQVVEVTGADGDALSDVPRLEEVLAEAGAELTDGPQEAVSPAPQSTEEIAPPRIGKKGDERLLLYLDRDEPES